MNQDSAHMMAASKVLMLKSGVIIEMPVTTAEEKAQRRLKDAKKLLEVVEKRFSGNAATKKTQRNLLKKQYENFTAPSSEMLDQTLDRLQKFVCQLELLEESFHKKMKLIVNGNETIGFDKSNVECYNCHKRGYFARKYRTPINQDNKHKESSKRSVPVETPTSTDLVSCDGLGGYDWSDQVEEGPNYALMDFSSSSFDSKVDSNYHQNQFHNQRMVKPIWNNAHRVDHQNFAKKTHPCAKKNMVPRAALMKSGLVSVNTAKRVNDAHSKTTVNATRPMSYLSKTSHSIVKRPFIRTQHLKTLIRASACWVWKPKHKVLDHVSKHNNALITLKEFDYVDHKGNPQMDLQDQEVIDSGCSKHMTGNMSYLTNYKEIDGGYVAFGGNPKRGKITKKGQARKGTEPVKNYILLPLWTADSPFSLDPKSSHDDGSKSSSDDGKKVDKDPRNENEYKDQEKEDDVNNTNNVNTISSTINTADDVAVADMNNLDTTIQVSPTPTTRIHKDHPLDQVIKDLHSATQTTKMSNNLEEHGFELCIAFEKLIHEKFQMSFMRELTFFLGLQVKQKKDGTFISQDKYVAEILKKFGFIEVKNASKPMKTQKPLLKDEDGEEVDFILCPYTGYQVNLKFSLLHAVKRIFRVLDLEKTKITQHNGIASLKRRVKKLEKRNRLRTYRLKRLYKVVLTAMVEPFRDEESLGKDASKQERKIDAIDADKDITLVNDADNDMFDVDYLVSTAATTDTTKEITLAQALEALKTLKPKVTRILFQEQGKTTTTISSQQSQDKGKRIMIEEPVKSKKKYQIRLGKEKRAGEELVQESTKKQKVEDNKEKAELKQLMETIPDEKEVAIDAIPLVVKSPKIIDWKIHKEGKKNYYQIVRADGKSQIYMILSQMLKSFDMEDFEDLYKLVKVRYGSTRPIESMDYLLWIDMKIMFEPVRTRI
nr:hypothetical protein [Tanacetum cinerariifolium]